MDKKIYIYGKAEVTAQQKQKYWNGFRFTSFVEIEELMENRDKIYNVEEPTKKIDREWEKVNSVNVSKKKRERVDSSKWSMRTNSNSDDVK